MNVEYEEEGNGRDNIPGRQAYLAIARERISLEDWGRIMEQAREDAVTAAAGVRDRTRRFLADYLIGKPIASEKIAEEKLDSFDEYANMSDEELQAIIDAEDNRIAEERAERRRGAAEREKSEKTTHRKRSRRKSTKALD